MKNLILTLVTLLTTFSLIAQANADSLENTIKSIGENDLFLPEISGQIQKPTELNDSSIIITVKWTCQEPAPLHPNGYLPCPKPEKHNGKTIVNVAADGSFTIPEINGDSPNNIFKRNFFTVDVSVQVDNNEPISIGFFYSYEDEKDFGDYKTINQRILERLNSLKL